MIEKTVTEQKFDIYGVQICAKRWRTKHINNELPVLQIVALHGWLDNAASFDFILPFFDYANLDVLSVDLAGHGLSTHRSGLSAYNIWSDVGEIHAVLKQIGWDKATFLGHSRGAMVATLYAGTFPEKVTSLVLIEAVEPQTLEPEMLPKQLAQSIEALPKLVNKKPRVHATFDDAVKARQKGLFHIPFDVAMAFAKRGVKKTEGGFCWGSDQKLLAPSEIKLSDAQSQAFFDNFPRQTLVILGEYGLLDADKKQRAKLEKQEALTCVTYNGDHHLHMTADKVLFEKLRMKSKIIV